MRTLLIAICLGGIFRLFWLSAYPIGFTPDEAAFGYNAYSLLTTGRDEWGTPFWDLAFTNLRSFGDYKLPIYSFFTVPTVAIFGLNEFATRLPNAIFGTLAIPAIFLFSKKLFKNYLGFGIWGLGIAQVSALLLALSPWSIQLSRGAFEANLVVALLPLALALLVSKKYSAAIIIFAINFYSYHTARYLTLIIGLFSTYFIPKKYLLLFILLLPGLYSLFSTGGSRVSDVSILNPTDNWAAVSDRRFDATIAGLPEGLARVFTNKPVFLFGQLAEKYLEYYSPQFLFSEGAKETTYGMAPGRGVLYLFQLPLLLLAVIFFSRYPHKKLGLLILLCLVSVIPAALAKGPGLAANRAIAILPFLTVLSSLGLFYVLKIFPRFKIILLSLFIVFLSIQTLFFLEDYLFHQPKQIAPGMLYGYKETIQRSQSMFASYPEIRVSRSLSEPHIFIAFYTHVNPKIYQQASRGWSNFSTLGYKFLDQYDGYRLSNFRFGSLNPENNSSPALLIGKPEDFPPNYPNYFSISLPNSQISVIVASTATNQ